MEQHCRQFSRKPYQIWYHVLKTIRSQPKSVYDIHDHISLHYMFQLRRGLSPLRSHKYRHKFSNTPNDTCYCHRGNEDEKQFLFECLQFANYRVSLAVKVTNILLRNNLARLSNEVNLYINGHPNLTIIDNKEISSATIHFIKCTERFKSPR